MPSAEEWYLAQNEVWEVDTEASSLDEDFEASQKRLTDLCLHEAELRHTLRLLRSSAAAVDSGACTPGKPWPPVLTSSAVELEAAFGRGVAAAWSELLKAIVERPRCISTVARVAGRRSSKQMLAHIAAVMSEAPLGCDVVRVDVLGEILAAELEASTSSAVPALLADGSFSFYLLQALTSEDPACEAWLRDALAENALETISHLLRPGSDERGRRGSSRQSSRPRSSSHSYRKQHEGVGTFIGEPGVKFPAPFPDSSSQVRQQAPLEASQRPAGPESQREPRVSIGTFLGQPGVKFPGPFPNSAPQAPLKATKPSSDPALQRESEKHIKELRFATGGPVSQPQRGSSTGGGGVATAAVAVVKALCKSAGAAPPGLCYLAATLQRRVGAGHQDLLGSLLLGRWLVPTLITPSLGLGLGLAHLALPLQGAGEVKDGVRKNLVELAKLLQKFVAVPSREPDGPAPASRGTMMREALLDTLAERGQELCSSAGEPGTTSQVLLPRCVVCPTGELVVLGQSLSASGVAETVAEATGMDVEHVRMLGNRLPSGSVATSPGAVVCWLNRCTVQAPSCAAPSRPEGDGCKQKALALLRKLLSAPRRLCGPGLGAGLGSLQRNPTSSSGSLADVDGPCVSTDGTTGSSCGTSGDVTEDGAHAGGSHSSSMAGHPSASAALAAALSAGVRRGGAWGREEELSRQLSIELLKEFLEEFAESRSPSCGSDAVREAEEELLQGLRQGLQAQRVTHRGRRNCLARLRIAERLAAERCSEVSQCLRRCAKATWALRWSACMQALWSGSSTQGSSSSSLSSSCSAPGGLGLGDLCVVGPPQQAGVCRAASSSSLPARLPGKDVAARRKTTWFSAWTQEEAAVLSNREASQKLQIVERANCPCHRMAAVGAAIGVEGLSPETGLQHFPVRNLQRIVTAFEKFPIETALQGNDPLGIAGALEELTAIVVGAIARHCRLDSCQDGPSSLHRPVSSQDDNCLRRSLQDALRGDERHLHECVTRFLFGQLHGRLFPTPSEPTDDDLKVTSQISAFAWLRPQHLDVPRSLVETPQAAHAAELLQKLCLMRCPSDMLDLMARAFRVVTQVAVLRSQLDSARPAGGCNAGGREGAQDAFGADEALPLFILVILRANPPMLASVLAYAERFTGRAQMLTQQGYALTQVRAAVSFTASARQEDLTNLQPGEWESHMIQGASSAPAVTQQAQELSTLTA